MTTSMYQFARVKVNVDYLFPIHLGKADLGEQLNVGHLKERLSRILGIEDTSGFKLRHIGDELSDASQCVLGLVDEPLQTISLDLTCGASGMHPQSLKIRKAIDQMRSDGVPHDYIVFHRECFLLLSGAYEANSILSKRFDVSIHSKDVHGTYSFVDTIDILCDVETLFVHVKEKVARFMDVSLQCVFIGQVIQHDYVDGTIQLKDVWFMSLDIVHAFIKIEGNPIDYEDLRYLRRQYRLASYSETDTEEDDNKNEYVFKVVNGVDKFTMTFDRFDNISEIVQRVRQHSKIRDDTARVSFEVSVMNMGEPENEPSDDEVTVPLSEAPSSSNVPAPSVPVAPSAPVAPSVPVITPSAGHIIVNYQFNTINDYVEMPVEATISALKASIGKKINLDKKTFKVLLGENELSNNLKKCKTCGVGNHSNVVIQLYGLAGGVARSRAVAKDNNAVSKKTFKMTVRKDNVVSEGTKALAIANSSVSCDTKAMMEATSNEMNRLFRLFESEGAKRVLIELVSLVPSEDYKDLTTFKVGRADDRLAQISMTIFAHKFKQFDKMLDETAVVRDASLACLSHILASFLMKEGGSYSWGEMSKMIEIVEERKRMMPVATPSVAMPVAPMATPKVATPVVPSAYAVPKVPAPMPNLPDVDDMDL